MNPRGAQLEISKRFVSFVRLRAEGTQQAPEFWVGNPVFEAGGAVDIREVPRG